MSLDLITYRGENYPSFQSTGNAARFAMPFAKEILANHKQGYDIGCMKESWSYPGSILIDIDFDDPWDAYNLPKDEVDYIFSSHCLEHLPDWVGALNYWNSTLRSGGLLFLYLPHSSQKYWHPWNNRKHYHSFDRSVIAPYFEESSLLWKTSFITEGHDLNNSFYVVAEKR